MTFTFKVIILTVRRLMISHLIIKQRINFAEKFKTDAPVLADLLVSDGLVEMQRKVQQKENGAVVVPCMILTA